jgi:hypothetical protein
MDCGAENLLMTHIHAGTMPTTSCNSHIHDFACHALPTVSFMCHLPTLKPKVVSDLPQLTTLVAKTPPEGIY